MPREGLGGVGGKKNYKGYRETRGDKYLHSLDCGDGFTHVYTYVKTGQTVHFKHGQIIKYQCYLKSCSEIPRVAPNEREKGIFYKTK